MAPWYIIAWRLIWYLPLCLSGFLFCCVVGVMYGPQAGLDEYDDLYTM